MKVLEYLKEKSLSDLEEEFGIVVRTYPEYDLAVLNYSQIDSPKTNPIVMECRGLIINYKDLYVVARSFDRFFNFYEWENDPFDYGNIDYVLEKADGSLMTVYYYRGEWHIASRGTCFAEGETATGKIFKDLFEEILGADINSFMDTMSTEYCYIFEMCSIHNKVVTPYPTPALYLLTVNYVGDDDFFECDQEFIKECAEWFGVKYPQRYSFKEVKKMQESFSSMAPTDEGYVIIDINGNRVKIKNPSYVDLHNIKGNGIISLKRVCNIVKRGESEEVLTYFPEYKEFFDPYIAAFDVFLKEVNSYDDLVEDKELSQKEFALKIKHLPISHILFSMRRGISKKDAIESVKEDSMVDILDTYIKN